MASTIILAGQIAVVDKRYAAHYLMPSVAINCLLVAAIAQWIRVQPQQRKLMAAIAGVAVLIIDGGHALITDRNFLADAAAMRDKNAAAAATVAASGCKPI